MGEKPFTEDELREVRVDRHFERDIVGDRVVRTFVRLLATLDSERAAHEAEVRALRAINLAAEEALVRANLGSDWLHEAIDAAVDGKPIPPYREASPPPPPRSPHASRGIAKEPGRERRWGKR